MEDTLFDHQAHRREALTAVKVAAGIDPVIEVASLEAAHERHLQRTHSLLLAGAMTHNKARLERLRETLAAHNHQAMSTPASSTGRWHWPRVTMAMDVPLQVS